MGTVRFVLRADKPDKESKCPVELIYSVEGQRKRYYPKQRIRSENWDGKKQQAIYLDKKQAAKLEKPVDHKELALASEVSDFNAELESLIGKVKAIEKKFSINAVEYSPNMVVDALKDTNNPATKKDARSKQLFDFVDKYIADHETTRKKGSLSVYSSLKNHLQTYQTAKKVEVTFDNMDYAFFKGFQNFLIDKQGLNNTTVAKQLSTIKTFINYARLQGVTVSDKYKDFKIKKENLEVIALTSEEFETLFTMDLSGDQRMAEIRDIFCFSCATGLRYSDLEQLEWMHINQDEIRLIVTKTSEPLSIPLNQYSRTILARYKDRPRPLPAHLVNGKYRILSNQKLNNGLNGYSKEDAAGKVKHYPGLCEIAGINSPVEIVRFRGAKRESKTYPKHELLSMHTGRKTFVTLSLEKGMSAEEVMTITGHLDYKSFKRYVKVTEKRKQVVMAKAWDNGSVGNLKAV